jgi:UDP-glucose 4-epimerase
MTQNTTAMQTQVVGRGYLGQVISSGISCVTHPISMQCERSQISELSKFIIIASGPSAPLISEEERIFYENSLTKLAKNIKKQANRSHVIYLSSGGTVYGENDGGKFSETRKLIPMSPYSKFQINAEKILIECHTGPTTILRLSNAYGPNQINKIKQGFVSAAVRAAVFDEELRIFGDGNNIRDYIHERDIIAAIKAVITNPAVGIFNVSTGIGTSQIEIVRLVEKVFEKRIKSIFLPKRKSDLASSIISPDLFKRQFGWNPYFNITEGVVTYKYLARPSTKINLRKQTNDLAAA